MPHSQKRSQYGKNKPEDQRIRRRFRPRQCVGCPSEILLERIERLEEEKKALAEDIRDVYAEAKGTGFEPRIMRKIVSLRKANLEKRREDQELLELYMAAIGMDE